MSAAKIIFQRLQNGATGDLADYVSPKQQFQTLNNRAPYVVYFRNQTIPTATKNTTSVVDEEVWIVQCFALSYDKAVELADAVRTDLDRAPIGSYSGVVLNGSSFRNQTDPEFDDKTNLFDCEVELSIRITRDGTLLNT